MAKDWNPIWNTNHVNQIPKSVWVTHQILIKHFFNFLWIYFIVNSSFELFDFLFFPIPYLLNEVHYVISCLSVLFDNCTLTHHFFKHLKEILHVKFHLRKLFWFCKSHPIWDLQPPELVSHVKDLEKQLKEIENDIYELQLELEVNSTKGRKWVIFIVWFYFVFFFTFDLILQIWFALPHK